MSFTWWRDPEEKWEYEDGTDRRDPDGRVRPAAEDPHPEEPAEVPVKRWWKLTALIILAVCGLVVSVAFWWGFIAGGVVIMQTVIKWGFPDWVGWLSWLPYIVVCAAVIAGVIQLAGVYGRWRKVHARAVFNRDQLRAWRRVG